MGFNENVRSKSKPCLRDYTRLWAQQFRSLDDMGSDNWDFSIHLYSNMRTIDKFNLKSQILFENLLISHNLFSNKVPCIHYLVNKDALQYKEVLNKIDLP